MGVERHPIAKEKDSPSKSSTERADSQVLAEELYEFLEVTGGRYGGNRQNGRPAQGHHPQPRPDHNHHMQPRPDHNHHPQPRPDHNHHPQPRPDHNHHSQPRPDHNHHSQPRPDHNHHPRPDNNHHQRPDHHNHLDVNPHHPHDHGRRPSLNVFINPGLHWSPPRGCNWGWHDTAKWNRGWDTWFFTQSPNYRIWRNDITREAGTIGILLDTGNAQLAAQRLQSDLISLRPDRYAQNQLLAEINQRDRKSLGSDLVLGRWDPLRGGWDQAYVVQSKFNPGAVYPVWY